MDEFFEYEMGEESEEEEREPVHPIFEQCRKRNLEAIREILKTDRTAVYQYGLIHEPSSMRGGDSPENIEVAKLLLSHGAFINSREEPWNLTPLHVASMLGREKLCEFLLTNGARYSLLSSSGETPFRIARKLAVVKALIR